MTQFWSGRYKGKLTGALVKDYFLLDQRESCEKMAHFLCDTWGYGSHLVTERRDVKITNLSPVAWDFPTFSTKSPISWETPQSQDNWDSCSP